MAEGDNPQGGADPTQAFQSRLAKLNGDAMQFATQLFDENWQMREKLRLAEGKAPAEGSVVLSKSDAEKLEAIKASGVKLSEIPDKLKSLTTLESENATLAKKDVLRDVALAHGYKLSVLQDLDSKAAGLEYKLKEEKDKSGETRKVAYVVVEGKESPLEEFASTTWADYLPALKAEQAPTEVKPGNGPSPRSSGGASVFDRTREQEKQRQESTKPAGSIMDRFRRAPASQ